MRFAKIRLGRLGVRLEAVRDCLVPNGGRQASATALSVDDQRKRQLQQSKLNLPCTFAISDRSVPPSQRHRHCFRHYSQSRVSSFENLFDRHAGCRLSQDQSLAGRFDDRQFGHDQINSSQ